MKFNINNLEIPISNISYHRKERSVNDTQYELVIPLIETNTIEILENFANIQLKSKEFRHKLLSKDKQLGSMGIIWNLLLSNRNIDDENKALPYYMLTSVDEIEITEENILIKGGCE